MAYKSWPNIFILFLEPTESPATTTDSSDGTNGFEVVVSSVWSTCSRTCGPGFQSRRLCATCNAEYQDCMEAECLRRKYYRSTD